MQTTLTFYVSVTLHIFLSDEALVLAGSCDSCPNNLIDITEGIYISQIKYVLHSLSQKIMSLP